MNGSKKNLLRLLFVIGSLPLSVSAAENTGELKHEIALLKSQMQNLEMRIASADQTNTIKADVNADTKVRTDAAHKLRISKKIQSAKQNNNNTATASVTPKPISTSSEISNSAVNLGPPFSWQGPDISALLVGGMSAGYSKPSGYSGSFNILDFNPIFLFSYRDTFFLRSAVDFSIDNQGNTAVGLNYINLNLILNDYAVFAVGKYDSAFGYFVQNLSPAWINRLPDAPVGFSSNQAAPQAEIGLQLRGGLPIADDMKTNYVFYVSNGPRAFADTTNSVINYIATDGYTSNNGDFVLGTRLGFLPIPKFEIGVSAVAGQAALIDSADGTTVLQKGRGYNGLGADISYKWRGLDFRGEYVQQKINAQSTALVPQEEKWKAWYLQMAYWIPSTKFEPVVRYGKFTSPVANQMQKQWSFGLDYWFAPSIAAQAAYELNSGQSGTTNNANLILVQLVFGF